MASTCDKYGTFVTKDNKAISNNRWGADTAQCIETVGDSGFRVTKSEHNKNGVAAYPSFYEGMWPNASMITKNSKFPVQISQMSGDLISRFDYKMGTGHLNCAYDVWFSEGRNTTHKLELMIWLDHTGMGPIGSRIGTFAEYELWDGWLGSTHVVSFRRIDTPSPARINISTFIKECVRRGWLQSDDYLTSVQCGFELWRGGAGSEITNYTVEYAGAVPNTGGNTKVPTDSENLATARTAICGGATGYPSTFHTNLVQRCQGLIDVLTGLGATSIPAPVTNAGGPFWSVQKASDDVAQQSASRFPAFNTNMNVADLIKYVNTLTAAVSDMVLPDAPAPTLTVPTGLTVVTNNANGTIMTNWNDVSGATEYDLRENVIDVVYPVTNSESLRGPFDTYREYSYSVRARNANTASGWSSPVTATLSAPTTTPPPTPSGTIRFNGDFSTGDLSQYAGIIRENESRTVVMNDPLGKPRKAVKLNVKSTDRPGDPNPRAQLQSPNMFGEGDLFYKGWSTYIPNDFPDFPSTDSSNWITIESLYGPPFAGTGPTHTNLLPGNKIGMQRTDTYNYDIAWSMPQIRGRWVDFVRLQKQSQDGSVGFIEMWYNAGDGWLPIIMKGGVKRLFMKTIDGSNNGGDNESDVRLYFKRGWKSEATIYHAAHKVGTTFDIVDPHSYSMM